MPKTGLYTLKTSPALRKRLDLQGYYFLNDRIIFVLNLRSPGIVSRNLNALFYDLNELFYDLMVPSRRT